MQEVMVQLRISADEYLKLYRGQATAVNTRAVDGRSVRFPAKILTPYVTRRGVHGVFIISFSDAGKFQDIRQLQT